MSEEPISVVDASALYRRITSEKVKKSYTDKKSALQHGSELVWGRPREKFTIAKALELYAQGKTYNQIAKALGGKVSYQTVRRRLIEAGVMLRGNQR